MQRTLTFHSSGSSEAESNPAFNVLIAYQDLQTGKHAKETYDYLQQNLGRECKLTNQMWKFEVLNIPKLREVAVHDATLADIIIVSSHGGVLPEPVAKWTESWLMQGTAALALVALFERGEEVTLSPPAARNYLAGVARRGGMEFFAQPDEWPGRTRSNEPFYLHSNMVVNQRTLTTLAGAVHREVGNSRWGINE